MSAADERSLEVNRQRSRDWIKANPERVARNLQINTERRCRCQEEMVADLAAATYKTPVSAIAAHCRLSCTHSRTRYGTRRTLKVEIKCDNPKCALYPFRNGDSRYVTSAKSRDNLHKKGNMNHGN